MTIPTSTQIVVVDGLDGLTPDMLRTPTPIWPQEDREYEHTHRIRIQFDDCGKSKKTSQPPAILAVTPPNESETVMHPDETIPTEEEPAGMSITLDIAAVMPLDHNMDDAPKLSLLLMMDGTLRWAPTPVATEDIIGEHTD